MVDQGSNPSDPDSSIPAGQRPSGGLASGPTTSTGPGTATGTGIGSGRVFKYLQDDLPSAPSVEDKAAQGKRKKVKKACLYCKRSHMPCDDGRPCQRCIKRHIGHRCRDEPGDRPAMADQLSASFLSSATSAVTSAVTSAANSPQVSPGTTEGGGALGIDEGGVAPLQGQDRERVTSEHGFGGGLANGGTSSAEHTQHQHQQPPAPPIPPPKKPRGRPRGSGKRTTTSGVAFGSTSRTLPAFAPIAPTQDTSSAGGDASARGPPSSLRIDTTAASRLAGNEVRAVHPSEKSPSAPQTPTDLNFQSVQPSSGSWPKPFNPYTIGRTLFDGEGRQEPLSGAGKGGEPVSQRDTQTVHQQQPYRQEQHEAPAVPAPSALELALKRLFAHAGAGPGRPGDGAFHVPSIGNYGTHDARIQVQGGAGTGLSFDPAELCETYLSNFSTGSAAADAHQMHFHHVLEERGNLFGFDDLGMYQPPGLPSTATPIPFFNIEEASCPNNASHGATLAFSSSAALNAFHGSSNDVGGGAMLAGSDVSAQAPLSQVHGRQNGGPPSSATWKVDVPSSPSSPPDHISTISTAGQSVEGAGSGKTCSTSLPEASPMFNDVILEENTAGGEEEEKGKEVRGEVDEHRAGQDEEKGERGSLDTGEVLSPGEERRAPTTSPSRESGASVPGEQPQSSPVAQLPSVSTMSSSWAPLEPKSGSSIELQPFSSLPSAPSNVLASTSASAVASLPAPTADTSLPLPTTAPAAPSLAAVPMSTSTAATATSATSATAAYLPRPPAITAWPPCPPSIRRTRACGPSQTPSVDSISPSVSPPHEDFVTSAPGPREIGAVKSPDEEGSRSQSWSSSGSESGPESVEEGEEGSPMRGGRGQLAKLFDGGVDTGESYSEEDEDGGLKKVAHLRPYSYTYGYAKIYSWIKKKRYSPENQLRVNAAITLIRPHFLAMTQRLSDTQLVRVEQAFFSLVEYYKRNVLPQTPVPMCVWRRTGEIYAANDEMRKLSGLPPEIFEEGQLAIYQLFEEDSATDLMEVGNSDRPAFFVALHRLALRASNEIPPPSTSMATFQVLRELHPGYRCRTRPSRRKGGRALGRAEEESKKAEEARPVEGTGAGEENAVTGPTEEGGGKGERQGGGEEETGARTTSATAHAPPLGRWTETEGEQRPEHVPRKEKRKRRGDEVMVRKGVFVSFDCKMDQYGVPILVVGTITPTTPV